MAPAGFARFEVVLVAGVVVAFHGVQDAAVTVGAPEVGVDFEGAGEVGDCLVEAA